MTLEGASGVVNGTTAFEAAEESEVRPPAFVTVTVQVKEAPTVAPLTASGLDEPVALSGVAAPAVAEVHVTV